MKIPLSWLKEYLEGTMDEAILPEALTMAGLEVGSVEEIEGDKVFDLEITPNRADCLSLLGIAREIKAIFRLNLKKPQFEIKQALRDDRFTISIADPHLCYRYAGRIIRNVKVTSSPEWLKLRLEKAGIRSINNVVDVTNYVLLEYGHPLHAFDLDLLEDYCIRVGTPKSILGTSSAEIETLDGVKRVVGSEDLLIWDGKRPVAVAGVMGGANTEVTDRTVNILLESAYFKPESIRKTAKRLGISTEASYRFERGTDIENLINALDRAAYLIQKLTGGEIYETIDVYPTKIPVKEISFKTDRIRKFIGLEIDDREILEILSELDIEVKKKEDFYIAKVPTHRQDLSIEEDIAEEVARIYGYDRVPAEMPKAFKPVKENLELSKRREFINLIRDAMISLGFSEAVNMSFMSVQDLDNLEIPQEDRRRKVISLLNPLRQEESVMRTMLTPSIIRNIERNTSRGIETIKLFEIGRVFFSEHSEPLPQELTHICFATKKEDFKSIFNEDPFDFYSLKGIVEGLLRRLRLKDILFRRSSEPFLHTGQSADIYINGEKFGFIGVLSPKVISKFDFKTKPYVCIAELNLEALFRAIQNIAAVTYKPFSNYPPIKRDTALLVPIDFEAQKIFDLISSYGNELVEDVYIFDVYKGKGIPEGKLSIAFRITYRASERTLTSEEVDTLHSKLIQNIISETGAELRF
ncbi:phenylalanine--tRNA ligase subunit beta [Thermodesulfovibrio sp.]|jgi:phenylalanyl-tRNA synthetase beta chain|uniref:phenylalanine--tRNA ligase subunit beta n=1 Tax=Thermodesulfovibrio TaxID=28261 RepID=UPI002611E9CC|nr:phenylalanine--tRNA ligase subunit beta [Thermodesulfovibrio sp.]